MNICFFEKINLKAKDAENSKLMLEVLDVGLLTNDLIGSFEIDMAFIYYSPDHTILHRSVALTNKNSKDYQKCTGYLKISVSMLHSKDTPITLEMDENADGMGELLMPPHIETKG